MSAKSFTHLHYNLKLKDDSVKRVQLLHISADFMFLTCHNPGCTRATTKTQICIQVLFKKLFILNKRGGGRNLTQTMACGWRMVYTMLFSAEQNQSQPKPRVMPQGKAPHNDWAVMAFIEHWHNWAQVLLLSLIGNDPLPPIPANEAHKQGSRKARSFVDLVSLWNTL